MSRRQFLSVVAGSALAAACAPLPATPASATAGGATSAARPIRAVAFDLFTIFDPRGVDQRVAELVPEAPTFATTWKSRLFEYSWIRAASARYVDFDQLVHDALVYAARTHRVSIATATRSKLEAAFTELTPWPDSRTALERLGARGLRLAPLANFAPRMIERLLANADLRAPFEALISTDRARTYKPDPRAYALGETTFGLSRSEIAFAAFGGWDAAGARWFGYPTFWVNRLAVPVEELAVADATGPDLAALTDWIASRS